MNWIVYQQYVLKDIRTCLYLISSHCKQSFYPQHYSYWNLKQRIRIRYVYVCRWGPISAEIRPMIAMHLAPSWASEPRSESHRIHLPRSYPSNKTLKARVTSNANHHRTASAIGVWRQVTPSQPWLDVKMRPTASWTWSIRIVNQRCGYIIY